jgi:hypothetical protein
MLVRGDGLLPRKLFGLAGSRGCGNPFGSRHAGFAVLNVNGQIEMLHERKIECVAYYNGERGKGLRAEWAGAGFSHPAGEEAAKRGTKTGFREGRRDGLKKGNFRVKNVNKTEK